MKRVILESPFQNKPVNVEYAKKCLASCLKRDEAPLASHLLYPGVLDDAIEDQRMLGMLAGHAWIAAADYMVVYIDKGITPGMVMGIAKAAREGLKIFTRSIENPLYEEVEL